MRPVGRYAVEILPVAATRSPEWHEARRSTVSASEIAAILGISPYQSAFDLWWSKRLGDSQADNTAMSRGRRAEPLVLEDFQDGHPELRIGSYGLVQRKRRPWQVCTPDAVAFEAGERFVFDGVSARVEHPRDPVAAVEAKTAGGRDGWGDNGTDEVPDHYRAQVIWQMDVLGVEVAYVPVWIGFDYRCYVVPYDAADAKFMRKEAKAFLASLEAGESPDIDSHSATTDRLKRLHPTVVDAAVDVPAPVVRQYLAAKRLRDTAADRLSLAENRLRASLGDHARGEVDGLQVCSRSVYDVAASTRKFPAYTVNKLTVHPTPRKPKRKRGRA